MLVLNSQDHNIYHLQPLALIEDLTCYIQILTKVIYVTSTDSMGESQALRIK